MLLNISMLFLIFLVPVLIIKYHNFIITKWIGTIGSAYLFGILLAILIFIVGEFEIDIMPNPDTGQISGILAISIAIPLLLFSANLIEAKKLSKTVLKSFASLVISAVIVTSITFFIYGKTIGFGAELSGMAIGLYTGGTPNLNAIGNIFSLDLDTIAVANLSDMIIGAIFYLFLLILSKPLLSKILKSSNEISYISEDSVIFNNEDLDNNKFIFSKELGFRFLWAFGITVVGALLGILIWIILGAEEGRMNDFLVPVMMVTVTILGIAFSFNEKIRKTKGMNTLGQYFILVFSFALASSLDFTELEDLFGDILVLFGIITLGVFVLHIIISKFMDIDVDCTIVTLTAGVYGPAFVPAISKQIKNDALTVPGLIVGSIGYAIGTFLGSGLGFLFLLF
ncbi:MAG: hypothetical protein KQ78_01097 [Candidatus Izimaplasma bacterium HR2]|nr:MAG: hypothetical protein KQ78_01097 [Candidatus Izimaplasma bacterium HR2]